MNQMSLDYGILVDQDTLKDSNFKLLLCFELEN